MTAPSLLTHEVEDTATADDEAARTLLEQPMAGTIRLALARSPSPRAASQVEGDRYRLTLARSVSSGEVIGMGARTVRPVFFDGEPARVGYLGQLRVEPGGASLRRWRRGFSELLSNRQPDELDFDLTTIATDNGPARRFLERGLPGMPRYEPLGEIETFVFATGRPQKRSRPRVPSLRPSELTAVLDRLDDDRHRYFLAPRWHRQDLGPGGRCRGLSAEDFLVVRNGDRLCGCAAIWDQRAFKQVVVVGYAPWLELVRPFVNLGLRALGQPLLPQPGTTLALAYLSHWSADDTATAAELLDAAKERARRRGLEQLVLSLPGRHPLASELPRLAGCRRYRTTLYAVGGAEGSLLERLRSGLLHLEGATL